MTTDRGQLFSKIIRLLMAYWQIDVEASPSAGYIPHLISNRVLAVRNDNHSASLGHHGDDGIVLMARDPCAENPYNMMHTTLPQSPSIAEVRYHNALRETFVLGITMIKEPR